MPTANMAQMSRAQRVGELTSDGFAEKLSDRHTLVEHVIDAVKESLRGNIIDPWEYPQIEAGLGAFTAAVYGLPVSIGESSVSSTQFPSLTGR